MVAGYPSTASGTANYADNLCRWKDCAPGHYEVWFLTLNDRANGRGYWFRYALESPLDADQGHKPSASLWAAAFDRADCDKNLALKQEYSIDNFSSAPDLFELRLGEGELCASQASGRVDARGHQISWNLHFTPNRETYHHVAPRLNVLARPTSFICSPNLDTRFSGVVEVDGSKFYLDGEPGCQSHLWGRKHVDEWVWLHSNAFAGHEGTVFEGLAARPRRAGHLLPPIQSLYLRHRGEEHRFIRLRFAEQWKHNLGIGFWSFSAMNTHVYMEGTAHCRLRDMVQAEYLDPDGEPLYCINSEISSLKIRLFRRVHGLHWRHVETIRANATAHLEHACRKADPDVRMGFGITGDTDFMA